MIPSRTPAVHTEPAALMSKKNKATCDDCYFRCAGLCALPGDAICPTFRLQTAGHLAPPKQAPLVPRPLTAVSAA
jgi:hypothetical protein